MAFENVFIPYGGYWSTPFVRWQGSFSGLHPILFAADVTRRALAERRITGSSFDALYLGMTVPAKSALYGTPWLAGLIGAPELTGPMFAQACATSARVIGSAAMEVAALGGERVLLCITADRTSNGPHLTYPNPANPGARPDSEDWVWDSFNHDPHAGNAMLETAENVAREERITTEEQHEVALLRYHQYQAALANDAAFHRQYLVTPIPVNPSGKKVTATVVTDEGILPTTAEGLAKLKPVLPGGTVTYGAQTHPADGNAGMIVGGREQAERLSRDPRIVIRVLGFGQARARKGFMPQAPIAAAGAALAQAGLSLGQVKVIKTHNPFAVNDICFARATGVKVETMNHYGSSLIWGHPQGPTGMRLVVELIEELVLLGGGYGLFTGCSAGDSAGAVVVQVGD